jgi:hypothetical protein
MSRLMAWSVLKSAWKHHQLKGDIEDTEHFAMSNFLGPYALRESRLKGSLGKLMCQRHLVLMMFQVNWDWDWDWMSGTDKSPRALLLLLRCPNTFPDRQHRLSPHPPDQHAEFPKDSQTILNQKRQINMATLLFSFGGLFQGTSIHLITPAQANTPTQSPSSS